MPISETVSTTSSTMRCLSKYEADEILASITDMAMALMPAREVAVLVGMTAEESESFIYALKNEYELPVVTAYRKGRLQTKLYLRKKVVAFAIKGSPAAQPLADSYLKENEYL